jgi:hypothetical protein
LIGPIRRRTSCLHQTVHNGFDDSPLTTHVSLAQIGSQIDPPSRRLAGRRATLLSHAAARPCCPASCASAPLTALRRCALPSRPNLAPPLGRGLAPTNIRVCRARGNRRRGLLTAGGRHKRCRRRLSPAFKATLQSKHRAVGCFDSSSQCLDPSLTTRLGRR